MKDVYGIYGDDGVKHNTIDDEEEKKLLEDDREMFNAADLNKDGFLSVNEHILFHSPGK